jgi:dephospho-CoA kinase
MKTNSKTKLILLAGLSGSGKSMVLDYCKSRGISNFYTGDLIPTEIDERDRIRFGDSLNNDLDFIRHSLGEAFRRNPSNGLLVLDSVRSLTELDYIRSLENSSYLVALLCEYGTRTKRVIERDQERGITVHTRDTKELGIAPDSRFNLGALLALADYYLDNSGTIEKTHEQLDRIITHINADPKITQWNRSTTLT